ncbi:RAMP superfamily CRISPR-associated protein [Methylobacter psychrophilus]|uniref:RAMP superfamily CRISPR-associated protein n=1 Tax=Methylobacter psychrophilus TaxID=96941 RepID=UPI0021D4BF87|nr:RAMP superfamily CRISPR-associated protein [Methylobacter psychrophilus]
MTTTAYRTLFTGILRQTTALSVGGRDLPSVTDAPLCRDGQQRFTLRGQTLAGALIATARRLEDVPEFISGEVDQQNKKPIPPPSRWRSFTSHPEGKPSPEIRQHVCIDPKTGAAMETGLFNLEVLPAGICWPFLLEVNSSGADGEQAEAIAWRALHEWQAGRCYIGREVARGMGWMQLDDLQTVRLSANILEHIDAWPNAERSNNYPTYVAELAKRFGTVETIDYTFIDKPKVVTLEIPFSITVGSRDNGYGLDSLSIGGHAESEVMASWQDQHYLAPSSLKPEQRAELFDPDFALVMTHIEGKRRPFIPGSALRGPLRHALERYYRANGHWEQEGETLRRFFGALEEKSHDKDKNKTTYASALLISDAELVDDNWQAAWFQLHAEDEFTAGAYSSSKFDRLALIDAKFTGCLVLETSAADELQFQPLLDKLKELAERGDIAIGGGQWRGHGWVSWHFEEPRRSGVAI